MDTEALVAQQRQHTAETWAVLRENGLSEGGALEVDTFLYADDESVAAALAAALIAEGMTASTESFREKVGLFRKKTVWSIQAVTLVPAASQESLADLAEAMVRHAARAGAVYDGWGAQIPEE